MDSESNDVLLFKVVRVQPRKVIRNSVDHEKGFYEADIIVAGYTVVKMNLQQKVLSVRALSTDANRGIDQQSFVLSVGVLSLTQILGMVWPSCFSSFDKRPQ